MIIGDIMTKEVITAGTDESISEVASLLAKNKIHGVPIVDAEKHVVGIITETDFFTKDASNIHLPSFIDFIKGEKMDKLKSADSSIKSLIQATAGDIMSTPCTTLRTDVSVEELIKLFKKRTLTTIPVVDEQDVLVGIVTVSDVIKLL